MLPRRTAHCLILSACLLLPCLPGALAADAGYTVQQGDTVYSLARRWGVDAQLLLTVNHLSSPHLAIGQTLMLPAGKTGTTAAPQTASSLPPQAALPTSHTVQPGQTLYSIAHQYGHSMDELQAFNHLSSPDLKPGQVLLLPQGAAPLRAAASPLPRPAPAAQITAPQVTAQSVAPQTVLAPRTSTPLTIVPARFPVSARPMPQPTAPAATPSSVQSLAAQPVPAQFAAATLSAEPSLAAPANATVHTVQPGQTLFGIARQYGVRSADLIALNHLEGSDLRPGQTLQIPGTVVAVAQGTVSPLPVHAAFVRTAPPVVSTLSVGTPLPSFPDEPPAQAAPPAPDAVPESDWRGADWHTSDWRSLAMSFMGVPYQYGGSSRSGTDCSGLVVQVFGPLGMKLPRQSALQAQMGVPVDSSDLEAGDLVFFDTEGRGNVTHVGIYLGDGTFINANSFDGRVSVNQMNQKYFAQRYLGARRVIGVLAQGN